MTGSYTRICELQPANGAKRERERGGGIAPFAPLDRHWTVNAVILRPDSTNLLIVFRQEEERQHLMQREIFKCR